MCVCLCVCVCVCSVCLAFCMHSRSWGLCVHAGMPSQKKNSSQMLCALCSRLPRAPDTCVWRGGERERKKERERERRKPSVVPDVKRSIVPWHSLPRPCIPDTSAKIRKSASKTHKHMPCWRTWMGPRLPSQTDKCFNYARLLLFQTLSGKCTPLHTHSHKKHACKQLSLFNARAHTHTRAQRHLHTHAHTNSLSLALSFSLTQTHNSLHFPKS